MNENPEKNLCKSAQSANSKSQVESLHACYCGASGRLMHIRYFERAWFELLRDYAFDAAALQADVALVVRYLLKMIDREKRNPGALKLSNFLQPDRFAEDLAEARAVLKKTKPQRTQSHEPEEQPPTEEERQRIVAAAKKGFAKIRQQNR